MAFHQLTNRFTEIPVDDPEYGYTDVTLARYESGHLLDHIPVTGSIWVSVCE